MLELLLSYRQVFLPKQVEVKPKKMNKLSPRKKILLYTFAPPPATIGPRYFSFSQRPRKILKF
jgi:hypothetical protein